MKFSNPAIGEHAVPSDITAMRHTLECLDEELGDMQGRYGAAEDSREAAFFHTTRAFASLDDELLAREGDPGRRVDRLVHLAAVCLRFAASMGVE